MGKQADAPKSVSDMFTSISAAMLCVAGPQRHSQDAGQLHWLGIAYNWGDVEAAMHELFVTPPSGTHLNVLQYEDPWQPSTWQILACGQPLLHILQQCSGTFQVTS